ncbi:MAG TPA: transcription elongation factor subunit Spt4 [Candidatus Nanoarchaeia archaeon]|nr:transcription elongation factor subunit Spt4 [Candidatus Nanoarchaeia archaeon]
MPKKVCRGCKLVVEKDVCPICHNADFVDNWKGRIFILNAEKSLIAQKVGIKQNGEYVIKTR